MQIIWCTISKNEVRSPFLTTVVLPVTDTEGSYNISCFPCLPVSFSNRILNKVGLRCTLKFQSKIIWNKGFQTDGCRRKYRFHDPLDHFTRTRVTFVWGELNDQVRSELSQNISGLMTKIRHAIRVSQSKKFKKRSKRSKPFFVIFQKGSRFKIS